MNDGDHINLHCHDEFSFLDGAMKNKELVERIAKLGQPAIATTNHGNIDGILRHQKACKDAGVQPIVGCELYMIDPALKDKAATERLERYHLTCLVRNMAGLKKLMRGLTVGGELMSSKNNRPILPLDLPLKDGWAGDVVLLSGCASSPFWKPETERWLPKYADAFGKDLYAEIMPLHDFEPQTEINAKALNAAKRYGLKAISTNDSHFLTEDCCEHHEVLLAVGTHQRMADPKRWKFDSKLNYVRTPNEMLGSYRQMGFPKDAAKLSILNSVEVAEKCAFLIDRIPVDLPDVLPPGTDEATWMVDRCAARLKKLGLWHKVEYQDRLEKELKAIIGGKFTRYILLIAELMEWCRANDIMHGPGRGSVSGSLVCYLLGITQVDPIPYKLVFERFISEARIDLPDIDLDFEDRKRWLIDQHLSEKYGANNVAKVSTFGVLRGKQAIKDVSRVYDVPMGDAQEMSNAIIIRPAADSRSSFGILDTVEMFDVGKKFNAKYPHVVKHAAALEGQIKNVGIHAAGRVISKTDLRSGGNCVLVKRGGKRGETVVNWDKKDLEHMGLMKLDVLGLATLSVLDECKKLVKLRHDKDIVWTELDLEDAHVYDVCISKGLTATCFQIGSRGLQKLSRDLGTRNFKILADSSALWRPGCLKSGITTRYVECHQGKERPVYINSVHKEICGDTYGQVLYQEQIMFFMYRMAGIGWKTADSVRKVISKKEGGAEWEKYKKMFVDGCVKLKTLEPDQAEKLWDQLKFFGMYAFNSSHSTAYSMMSFWTAWAKVYYPAEYLCSFLNYGAVEGKEGASQQTKLDEALREARRLGLKISRPDVNRSANNWSIHEDTELVAGLSEIKGISPDTGSLLIEARNKAGGKIRTVSELVQHVDRRKVHKGVVQKLLQSGAFDNVDLRMAKLWILNFEELYPYVLVPKKLQALLQQKEASLDEQWALHEAELVDQKNLSLRYKVEFGGGTFGRFRKFLKGYLDIQDIAKLEKVGSPDEVYLCGVAASIKYGYRENVKMAQQQGGPTEQSGTKEGMGGVYGIFDDGTGFSQSVYGPELYRRRKATIESLAGKTLLIKAKYNRQRSNLFVNEFWTLEELSAGKFRGLRLRAMEGAPSATSAKAKQRWVDLRAQLKACTACELRSGCSAPTPFSRGTVRLAVVGEAPGRDEEAQGKGFVGASGRELWKELAAVGIDREMCMVANAVACRPTIKSKVVEKDNKLPNITYINKCAWLTQALAAERPLAILAVGNSAMYYFNGQPKGIRELNGTSEWVPKANAWVTYCIHPASVLYDPANRPELVKGVTEFARIVGELS